jgi:GNAT superfamily N-acetyltransferase
VNDENGTSPVLIRRAVPEEFDRLRQVELESDRLLAQVGIGPFLDVDDHRLVEEAVVFAAGEPAVGFVSVRMVDGEAHIDQLSVVPEHGRQGIGRALLDHAISWARHQGLPGVTLTTFSHVPWNAPFYRRVGFEVVSHPTPGLAAIRADERELGIDAMGPRVAMRKVL